MAASGGLSFVNVADHCKIFNLRKISGNGTVSIVAGSYGSLKTRQFSDVMRIGITGRNSGTTVIAFDVVANTAPSEFGANPGFYVGTFGMFGIVPVSSEFYGTVYPPHALQTGVTVTLRAYATDDATGTVMHSSVYNLIANPLFQSGSIQMTAADSDMAQQPYSVFSLLDSPAPRYYGDGWGDPGVGGNVPKSFRVEMSIPYTGSGPAAADWMIDIGRLWIGNALRPKNGVNNVSFGIIDTSIVTPSRDGQMYPQRFNRCKTMTLQFPALYELEALGIGISPLYTGGGSSKLMTLNNLQQAMYAAGLSGNVVAWANDYATSGAGTGVWATEVLKLMTYGRPTAWQPIAQIPARKGPVAGSALTDRMWTGGLTVAEER